MKIRKARGLWFLLLPDLFGRSRGSSLSKTQSGVHHERRFHLLVVVLKSNLVFTLFRHLRPRRTFQVANAFRLVPFQQLLSLVSVRSQKCLLSLCLFWSYLDAFHLFMYVKYVLSPFWISIKLILGMLLSFSLTQYGTTCSSSQPKTAYSQVQVFLV